MVLISVHFQVNIFVHLLFLEEEYNGFEFNYFVLIYRHLMPCPMYSVQPQVMFLMPSLEILWNIRIVVAFSGNKRKLLLLLCHFFHLLLWFIYSPFSTWLVFRRKYGKVSLTEEHVFYCKWFDYLDILLS